MLIVSILGSFLTAVFLSRLLTGLLVHSGWFNKKLGWFGVKPSEIHNIKENFDTIDLPTKFDKFDFVKHHKKFFAFSGILTVLGIIFLIVFHLNLSIDFSSGTRVEIMAKDTITASEVTKELNSLHLDAEDITLSGKNNDVAVARLKGVLSKDEISTLKAHIKDKFGAEPNVGTVSPTVGKELAKNAIIAVAIASIGIIIYVTLRFEMYMALAAIVALLHDAFLIVTVFSITRLEVDLTFIAAVLTIIGYSINDTIVTFDRMRENMHKKKRLKTINDIIEIVNTSLRQTLTRSVNTVLTVIITVVALLIFGSDSIRNFSIALLIGLITGMYSSIFIAAQLWLVWKGKELKKKGVIRTVKEKRKYSDQPQV
jgi:SecD/SecF fusion protein